jgi:SAM-dependent methyltransferase
MSQARAFLVEKLTEEFAAYFGVRDPAYIESVAEAWMNDGSNSRHRFDKLEALLLRPRRVLDMAAGCGTCVFYGLLNGYDMYGIDPEDWKYEFNRLKADEYGYDPSWKERFLRARGEEIPFPDSFFDAVTSYQTLEHVQDPEKVLGELVRVVRPGGGIHLQCPDYRGTFEGHYRLPWLPLFPRPLAKRYLGLAGRPGKGLDTIQYITLPRLLGWLKKVKRRQRCRLAVLDFKRIRYDSGLGSTLGFRASRAVEYGRALFRRETDIDLFIHVLNK